MLVYVLFYLGQLSLTVLKVPLNSNQSINRVGFFNSEVEQNQVKYNDCVIVYSVQQNETTLRRCL